MKRNGAGFGYNRAAAQQHNWHPDAAPPPPHRSQPMAALFRYPLPLPPTGAALIVLCALYLFPGLFGHDPWKPDDATHFGIAYNMLTSGDWLTLQLAGEPYFENPPLYYWVAAACARLFAWLLPLHDAARLASGLFGAALLAALAGAAREFHAASGSDGAKTGSIAALLTVGCLGLVVHLHDAQPQTAVLATSAGTFYGMALLQRRPFTGGAAAGAAVGVGFLAGGLQSLVLMLPLLIAAPFCGRTWRTPKGLAGLLLGLLVATAISASWPALLLARHPQYLEAWWARELASLQPTTNPLRALQEYFGMLPWFAWPALPLACWTLWRERRALGAPGIMLPLLGFAIALALLGVTLEARSVNALPLLVPLALLAVPAASTLRRGAANAFDWFGMMTFTLISGLVWLAWIAMLTGWPPRLARNIAKLEPGFVLQFSPLAFTLALLLTLAWLWFIIASPRAPERSSVHWAGGVIVMWGLVTALWLPLIDYGKSYRAVAESLARTVPKNANCIIGRDIGDAQRASFHYFANLVTRRDGSTGAASCRLLLVQSSGRGAEQSPGRGWRKIWEDRRRGDRYEQFRLYRRE